MRLTPTMVPVRPLALSSFRFYSTNAEKPPLKLVAELRKLTEVSITKAREALAASNNDVSAALKWLQNDIAVSGAKKAAKIAHRTAGEGLVAASVLSRGTGSSPGGVRAALVELNCETDFVARNALFGRLVADIAHTAAFLAESGSGPDEPYRPHEHEKTYIHPVPRDRLLDAPLLSTEGLAPNAGARNGMQGTVGNAIRDAIAKLGENIVLQRAVSVVHDPVPRLRGDLGLRVASYTHGGVSPSQGRIGALALIALKSPRLTPLLSSLDFRQELERIERSLARQIVGFDTLAIRGEEGALYDQPFMMFGDAHEGETVGAGLARWARQKLLVVDTDGAEAGGVEVAEFVKWTVGESSDAA
ncbi:elongation factor TS-domain-containing protein [Russula emetica]|nr:elongation factor TS-domain-containing protein [Russula emetica]